MNINNENQCNTIQEVSPKETYKTLEVKETLEITDTQDAQETVKDDEIKEHIEVHSPKQDTIFAEVEEPNSIISTHENIDNQSIKEENDILEPSCKYIFYLL